jgi:hypothetical protein
VKPAIFLGFIGLAAGAFAFGGCSEKFGDKVSEHRNCIGDAGIAPEKVDDCLHNTDGRREHVDVCLSSSMVPERKIARLNDCVEASEHRENY